MPRIGKHNAGISVSVAAEILAFIDTHEPSIVDVCSAYSISRATFKRYLDCLRLGGADVVAMCEKRGPGGSAYFYKHTAGTAFKPERIFVPDDLARPVKTGVRSLVDGIAVAAMRAPSVADKEGLPG